MLLSCAAGVSDLGWMRRMACPVKDGSTVAREDVAINRTQADTERPAELSARTLGLAAIAAGRSANDLLMTGLPGRRKHGHPLDLDQDAAESISN